MRSLAGEAIAKTGEVFGPFQPFGPPKPWTTRRVLDAAAQLRSRYNLNADPIMVAAMAQIESTNNQFAERYEAHLNDSSYGLMQTMLKTAQWLYDDMGYRGYSRPTAQSLTDGMTSLYFGMAYINWLSRYNGSPRSENWIVESYNGGPGNSNAQTRNHWNKYQAAKAQIQGVS